MKKVSVIAAAVASALFAGSVAAETDVALDVTSGDSAMEVEVANPTEVISDGWEVHGYMSANFRMKDGETIDSEFGKPDYHSAGTSGQSTNQVEFTIKKHTEHNNGVWSDFVVRSEFGNGNSFAYSSEGSQKANDKAQFEIKEAYVELGGISFLGDDTSIWSGHRYFNRSAGLLSGEFWNQSSGLGAGFQTKLGGNTAGFAVIAADTNDDINGGVNSDRETNVAYNAYYHGVQGLGGSFNFDVKYITRANKTDPAADNGVGAAITYNRDYYGFDGWSQTGIAYGYGAAANRGVNFGAWSGDNGFSDDSNSIFLTSYGVANLSDSWQLGTEVTAFITNEMFGQDDLTRILVAARPSYKINDNLRFELTGSVSKETIADGAAWGRQDDNMYYMLEAALPVTVNADYFGRPQIKPYVTYYNTEEESAGGIGLGGTDGKEVIVGIHTEIWF